MTEPPLVRRAEGYCDRLAIIASDGVCSYGDLLEASAGVAARLGGRLSAGPDAVRRRTRADSGDPALPHPDRVCFLVPPGHGYAAVQWGIWRAGAMAVPLATSHPPAEIAFVLDDARPVAVVVHEKLRTRVESMASERGIPVLDLSRLLRSGRSAAVRFAQASRDRPAMILYTSGTTGSPKGVVITHGNIQAQVESLSAAWGWSRADRILLHLPLHHVHGIVNVLVCSLWNGAVCEILPRFNPIDVWERLSRAEITLYMGVPTTYRRLADTWRRADPDSRAAWTAGARACRLMVSGSAALPVPLLERWEGITGQRLLERYGMTETGMILSNPLEGKRRAGRVGTPLPGVEVRLEGPNGERLSPGSPGEIQVRGPTVFKRYWERSRETEAAFAGDGWFRTGDIASLDESGSYRILGRSDLDILKTGGEKISALEVEGALRAHAGVADCAVVGVEDEDWGERVCAAVLPAGNRELDPDDLIRFARERLAPYKVPKQVVIVSRLPRNALGKVTKARVKDLFPADPVTA